MKSSSYEIKYDGKTYSGDAIKARYDSYIDNYVWTSGGNGGATVIDKKLASFSYTDNNGVRISAEKMPKRSLEIGEIGISLSDIELIIIDE